MLIKAGLKGQQRAWLKSAWCAAMVAVTVLALLPVEHLPLPAFNLWDKAQHALAFAVLTVGACLLWPRETARVAAGMIAYGTALEMAQWAVGWRFAELSDLLADAVGVLAAVALRWWIGEIATLRSQ
jgi:VanZ family protein